MATDATLAMRAVELKKGQSFAPLCKMVASHVYGRSILNSCLASLSFVCFERALNVF